VKIYLASLAQALVLVAMAPARSAVHLLVTPWGVSAAIDVANI
jgi:hypothetical protein